jgi:hypothetical protein
MGDNDADAGTVLERAVYGEVRLWKRYLVSMGSQRGGTLCGSCCYSVCSWPAQE